MRSIGKEEGEDGETGSGRGVVGRLGGRDRRKVEQDYELFLRDLEEDPEMRGAVNLYKVPEVKMASATASGAGAVGKRKGQYAMEVDEGEEKEYDDEDDEDENEPEADFPEVKLEELLEEFDEMTITES